MGKLTMSSKERTQLRVFTELERGAIKQVTAAELLGISTRWAREKAKRYSEHGAAGLVHRSRGKPSNRRWDSDQCDLFLRLMRGEWHGFGPTFAAEKLRELHGITVSPETIRKTLIANGLWVKRRRHSAHRKRRERREIFGQMVQLDGSIHNWFEGRGTRCTLLVFIDDATSKILWLEFVKSESVESIMSATRRYFEAFGIPRAFYVDFASTFSVNVNNAEKTKVTQFQRACQELDVQVIHATSPQAKGRVERCNRTLQDRLIHEMRLAGISSIKAANRFVQQGFIQRHNDQFAVKAAREGDAHREAETERFDQIFCLKENRIVQNDFVVSYKKQLYQILKHQKAVVRPKETVDVHEHFNGTIQLFIRGIELNIAPIDKRPQKLAAQPAQPRPRAFYRPSDDHPWRRRVTTPSAQDISPRRVG